MRRVPSPARPRVEDFPVGSIRDPRFSLSATFCEAEREREREREREGAKEGEGAPGRSRGEGGGRGWGEREAAETAGAKESRERRCESVYLRVVRRRDVRSKNTP